MNQAPPKTMQVDITDISHEVFSGLCRSLTAPAAFGEVCILPRHAPFLSKLIPGEIRLQTERGEGLQFYVSGGYLEVKSSMVTVLADQLLRSDEIDRQAALRAKASAERTLKTSPVDRVRDQAKIELAKAIAQLKLTERGSHKHRR